MPNTVSILSLPPAGTVPQLREEVPDWAIPSYAPPGLEPQERETKLVKIEISPVLRPDVSKLHLMVRLSLLPTGLRQRLEEILMVPADRLRLFNMAGELLHENLGIPEEIKVHDMWEKHAVVYDILDIAMDDDPHTRFMVKIDQTWTNDQLVSHLSKIMSKDERQLRLSDLAGAPWRYPDDRHRTSTIMVKVVPQPVTQVDLLGSMGDLRGGAGTVSTTQTFHATMENGGTLHEPGHDVENEGYGGTEDGEVHVDELGPEGDLTRLVMTIEIVELRSEIREACMVIETMLGQQRLPGVDSMRPQER